MNRKANARRLIGGAVPIAVTLGGLLIAHTIVDAPLIANGFALVLLSLLACAAAIFSNATIEKCFDYSEAGDIKQAQKHIARAKHFLEGLTAGAVICSVFLIAQMFRA